MPSEPSPAPAWLHSALFDLRISGEPRCAAPLQQLLARALARQPASAGSGRTLCLHAVDDLPAAPAEARRETAGRIHLATLGDTVWFHAPGCTARIELAAGTVHLAAGADFAALPLKERIDLLAIPLLHLLRPRGVTALHASAVASPQGAVVCAGVSGSGKSTTAGSLDAHGWPRIADDMVLLAPPASPAAAPAVAALVLGAACWGDSAVRLGLASTATADAKHFDAGVGLPGLHRLGALVFPTVLPGPTRLQRLAPTAALLRLLPAASGIVADSVHAHAQMQGLKQLLRTVPAYRWSLGQDSFGNGALLAAQLEAALAVERAA